MEENSDDFRREVLLSEGNINVAYIELTAALDYYRGENSNSGGRPIPLMSDVTKRFLPNLTTGARFGLLPTGACAAQRRRRQKRHIQVLYEWERVAMVAGCEVARHELGPS